MMSLAAGFMLYAAIVQVIPFTSVAQGTSSQIDEPRKIVVRSAEEFQALWKSHSTPPLPKVDFSKSIVVGVFLGMRPTAGYTVGIQAVRRTEGGAVVEYIEGRPERPDGRPDADVAVPSGQLPGDVKTVEFKQVPGQPIYLALLLTLALCFYFAILSASNPTVMA